MAVASQSTAETEIYTDLGLVPVINARGNQTLLGGSTVPDEVQAAIDAANRYYVVMEDLFAATGRVIADLLECEAAYVTSGCAAALALGAAACIAGDDEEKVKKLPHTEGMKNEVVIQGTQRYKYEHAPTVSGAKLVEAGDANGVTPAQLEEAIGPDTAVMLFVAHMDAVDGIVPLDQVIEISHRHGVPVMVDAAQQIYPLERMRMWTKMGADLVCFGAKYFGSPHSSGILCGREELVASAVRQGFIGFEIGASSIGRPFKLDRGEVIGVVHALRRWLSLDHEERIAAAEAKLEVISAVVEGKPGVNVSTDPGVLVGAPALCLNFEPESGLTAESVIESLRDGNPSIVVGEEGETVVFNPNTLLEGDAEVVAERLAGIVG
ncbi:MAG: aminotransferase class V-fold PLP-dependent enzyme [Chloroflexi bacterium]|nr:aminotransferase class V-fold PLP-dependent enzyme [Chloroflexota bacterium]MCY3936800.1 aminotransferase class V-fold PLP-dependent enzyme [Chloroflexota bacterium]